jgi:hypothetical protein
MAARPTRIVADVRMWSVCGSSPLRRRDYIRRPQLLTYYATGQRQAHLTKGYSPNCVEQEFSEVRQNSFLYLARMGYAPFRGVVYDAFVT